MRRKDDRRVDARRIDAVHDELIQSLAVTIGVREQIAGGDHVVVGGPGRPPNFRARDELRHDHRVRVGIHGDDADAVSILDERDVVAVGRPGGAADAAATARERGVAVRAEIVHPQFHPPAAVARKGERRAVGRPRGIELHRRVVRHLEWVAVAGIDRHHPDVAERDERHGAAVGRDDRRHDAADALRRRGLERPVRDRVRRPLQREVRPERNRLDAAGQRARPEREHVLVARDGCDAGLQLRGHLERRLAGRVRELGTVRTPRRRCGGERWTQQAFPAARVDGPQAGRRSRHALVAGYERDLTIVGRPRRHPPVARRQPAHLAGSDGELPNRADAAVAIGRERDARAVVRPRGLAIVELAARQRAQVRAVPSNRVDVPRAVVAVALERDRFAVRRPGGEARLEQIGGDSLRDAARDRQQPETTEQIDCDCAVGRHGRGHRRAFSDREIDRAAAVLRGKYRGRERCEEQRSRGCHLFTLRAGPHARAPVAARLLARRGGSRRFSASGAPGGCGPFAPDARSFLVVVISGGCPL